jgi:hypothetical protein
MAAPVPVSTLQIITVAVAVYAAVVATITGMVQIFNYRRDRARIKVTVGHNTQIWGDARYMGKTLTIVKVLNEGRRPVTITTVGARRLYPNTHFVIVECQPSLPYELTEGKSLMAILPSDDMDDFSTIESWEAVDAVGRTYRLHIASWYSRAISHARLRREWRRSAAAKKHQSATSKS